MNRSPVHSPTRTDVFASARKVADAVLYEGYVLYPYRASASKNQIRWQFGVVAPRAFAETDTSEDWVMQTECLLDAGMDAELDVRIRFLRVQERQVQRATSDGFEPVATLEVNGSLLTSWDEAIEEEINLPVLDVANLLTAEHVTPISRSASEEAEVVFDLADQPAGRVLRRCEALTGAVRVTASVVPGPDPLIKIRVRVENDSPWDTWPGQRDDVVRRSLTAVHTLIAARNGRLLSLADPPDSARAAAASCSNLHTWPVLVGHDDDNDVVLSSPVTLSDHPEIAPESPGDMFDATEIDEILALRVMTLTEEEKREARSTDPRAAAIIDRCDILPEEIFERLHGAVRYLRDVPNASSAPIEVDPFADPFFVELPPRDSAGELQPDDQPGGTAEPSLADGQAWGRGPHALEEPGDGAPGGTAEPSLAWWNPDAEAEVDPFSDRVWVGPVSVGTGTRVRLRPARRADAHDIFLAGREATVQGVFQDVDGNTQIAVSVLGDDDAEYQLGHGRYLFFHPDEVEPLVDRS